MLSDLPQQYFKAIEADPPWRFLTWSDTNQKRSASRYYRLMRTEEIAALPVADVAGPSCALFLWAINPMLPDALAVMAAWGFKFKTIAFAWGKTTTRTEWSWAPNYHAGLGYWTRANVELCLLGIRGKPKRLAKDVRQLIISPRRRHSQKPPEARERIERLVAGPYLELFARTPRDGWTTWGNES